jgi:hypothetical protein
MKTIKQIEIYYEDDSMEKITKDNSIFSALVEEIKMTKLLFNTADQIEKEYNDLVKKL